MRAILNISLDDKVCPDVSDQRRFEIVRSALRICFESVVGEIQAVSYDGPNGRVNENTGVFTVECDATRASLENAIYCISKSLGQDCIAVMHDNEIGKCIGPKAHLWPFDSSYFRQPARIAEVV